MLICYICGYVYDIDISGCEAGSMGWAVSQYCSDQNNNNRKLPHLIQSWSPRSDSDVEEKRKLISSPGDKGAQTALTKNYLNQDESSLIGETEKEEEEGVAVTVSLWPLPCGD